MIKWQIHHKIEFILHLSGLNVNGEGISPQDISFIAMHYDFSIH